MSKAKDFEISKGVLKKYTGPGGEVIVPGKVKEIGFTAFQGCDDITKVVLPDGLKQIGEYAFAQCSSLENINIPSSVEYVASFAFQGCFDLKYLELFRETEVSGLGHFGPDYKNLIDERGFLVINHYLLRYVGDEKIVTVPSDVLKIGEMSFARSRDNQIQLLIIPGTPDINPSPFGLNAKDSIPRTPPLWFPDIELKDIHKNFKKAAVEGFVRLYHEDQSKIATRKPEYVKYLKSQRKKYFDRLIREEALLNLFLNESVITPEEAENLLEWGQGKLSPTSTAALLDYTKEEKHVDPLDSLESETESKPLSLSELKKIWSYKEIKDGTLIITSYKGDTVEIIVPEKIGKKAVSEIGEEAFAPGNNRISNKVARRNIKRVTIPAGVKTLEAGAFQGCRMLSDVVLPEGLTMIGNSRSLNGVFAGCEALTRITLPDTLEELGNHVFHGCEKLTDLVLPQGVKKIGSHAFEKCYMLEEITIPEKVTRIEYHTFFNCINLKVLHLSENVKVIDRAAFTHALTIYAPAGSYAEQYAKENNIPFVAE